MAILALAAPALAAPPSAPPERHTVRMHWSIAPPVDCVDANQVFDDVTLRLSDVEFVDSRAAEFQLELRFFADGALPSIELVLSTAAGEFLGSRTLRSATGDCAELRALLPTVISVALDWSASPSAPASPPPAPVPAKAATRAPATLVRQRVQEFSVSPRRSPEITLAALVQGSYEFLPAMV